MLKGWTFYHLSLVTIFTAIIVFLGSNAFLVRSEGGYEVSSETILPFNETQVWLWVTENKKRNKWQVSLHDLSRLHSSAEFLGSTRMLFFRLQRDKWTAIETTLKSTPPVLWEAQQVMSNAVRTYTIELHKIEKCRTKIIVREKASLFDFTERFWLFWKKSEHQKRLNLSLQQLKRWMDHKKETCDASTDLPATGVHIK